MAAVQKVAAAQKDKLKAEEKCKKLIILVKRTRQR